MILFCLIEPGLLKRILTITLYAKINSFMYIAMMMAFSEWFISNSTEKTARFRLCLELRVSEGRDEASGFLYVAHKESEAPQPDQPAFLGLLPRRGQRDTVLKSSARLKLLWCATSHPWHHLWPWWWLWPQNNEARGPNWERRNI